MAQDFSFEGPTTVPAGAVSITLTNEGQEEHQAQVARLNDGVTFEDLVAAFQQPDPTAAFGLITFVGGPTGVAPGAEGVVSMVGEPGAHVLLCFLAGADGIPHLAKGQLGQLEVTEPAAGGELPAGDAQLTLQDFSFVGLDTLPAGEQVVSVTNSGPQPHEATLVRLAEGTTVEDVFAIATASAPPSEPPPFTSAGGIAALAQGLSGTMTLDLEPGDYAFVCFVPDPGTGKSHLELGMIGGLTVQ